jgi:hypothetical protein
MVLTGPMIAHNMQLLQHGSKEWVICAGASNVQGLVIQRHGALRGVHAITAAVRCTIARFVFSARLAKAEPPLLSMSNKSQTMKCSLVTTTTAQIK